MQARVPLLALLSAAFVLLSSVSAHDCRDRVLEEKNKRIVLNFYQELLGDKKIESIDKYVDENGYIQHNPEAADGREGLKEAFKAWSEKKVWFTEDKVDILRSAADGDFVWLHSKTMRDGKLTSIMDIFKVKDGKVVEHWDVYQSLANPPKNDHPLF